MTGTDAADKARWAGAERGGDRSPRPSQVPGGFLNVNKPPGMTSMDVIRVVRRLTGQRKAGHGGTLDPDASGVLPVCIGRATRFIDRFVRGRKIYEATARFGTATDTYDASGRVIAESDPALATRDLIEAQLPRFTGEISQVPPMYSALKKDGVRLYKLARAGQEVERDARDVVVHSLAITSWNPPLLGLRVECGSGFYARALVHDLGLALGGAAHLAELVRTRVGPFELDGAATLETLEAAAGEGAWEDLLHPIDSALLDLSALVLDPIQEEAVSHGRAIDVATAGMASWDVSSEARAYNRAGELIAVMNMDVVPGRLVPARVIAAR